MNRCVGFTKLELDDRACALRAKCERARAFVELEIMPIFIPLYFETWHGDRVRLPRPPDGLAQRHHARGLFKHSRLPKVRFLAQREKVSNSSSIARPVTIHLLLEFLLAGFENTPSFVQQKPCSVTVSPTLAMVFAKAFGTMTANRTSQATAISFSSMKLSDAPSQAASPDHLHQNAQPSRYGPGNRAIGRES